MQETLTKNARCDKITKINRKSNAVTSAGSNLNVCIRFFAVLHLAVRQGFLLGV